MQGDTCKEIRIRHDVSLKDADVCLLYNSDSFNGHYSAICRDDEMLLETEKVTPKQGYRKELDVEWERNVKANDMGFRVVGDLGGRTDSDMVLISGDMFDGLLKDRDFATKVSQLGSVGQNLEGTHAPPLVQCPYRHPLVSRLSPDRPGPIRYLGF